MPFPLTVFGMDKLGTGGGEEAVTVLGVHEVPQRPKPFQQQAVTLIDCRHRIPLPSPKTCRLWPDSFGWRTSLSTSLLICLRVWLPSPCAMADDLGGAQFRGGEPE